MKKKGGGERESERERERERQRETEKERVKPNNTISTQCTSLFLQIKFT